MKTQKKAEAFDIDRWILTSQVKKCKICRCPEASKVIDEVLAAAKRHGVSIAFQRIAQLLSERNILSVSDHTVRDHARRCNVKTKAQ